MGASTAIPACFILVPVACPLLGAVFCHCSLRADQTRWPAARWYVLSTAAYYALFLGALVTALLIQRESMLLIAVFWLSLLAGPGLGLINAVLIRSWLSRAALVETRVCGHCRYDLRGLPPTTSKCPECGTQIKAQETARG